MKTKYYGGDANVTFREYKRHISNNPILLHVHKKTERKYTNMLTKTATRK